MTAKAAALTACLAVGLVLLTACNPTAVPGPFNPAGDHIGVSGHTTRFFTMYDETGDPAWLAAESQLLTNWSLNFVPQHAAQNLPYIDWRTSGGTPGCYPSPPSADYALDFCVGDTAAACQNVQAIGCTQVFLSDGQHESHAWIIVPPSATMSVALQRYTLCHEFGHFLGLAHSPGDPSSCMFPGITGGQPGWYDGSDQAALTLFYGGHTP